MKYYVDNCAAQNKNRAVVTALTRLINSTEVSTDSITLKNIFNFDDFSSCIKGGNIDFIKMSLQSFVDIKGLKFQTKLKRAKDNLISMRVIQFRRGE